LKEDEDAAGAINAPSTLYKVQFLYPCNYPGEGLNAGPARYTHHSEVTNHLLSSKQSTINI